MVKFLYTEGQKAFEAPLPVSLMGNGIIDGHIHKVKQGFQYCSRNNNSPVLKTFTEVQHWLSRETIK